MDGKWTPLARLFSRWTVRLARDPRGRLEFIAGALRAYLPGTTCSGQFQPQLGLTCSPGNETWPINPQDAALPVRWVSDSNVLESAGVKGSFYNAAQGLFASSSESIQDRAGVTAAGTESWGNDLAVIANPCGSGNVLIVSMPDRRPGARPDAGFRNDKRATGCAERSAGPPGRGYSSVAGGDAGASHASGSKLQDWKL